MSKCFNDKSHLGPFVRIAEYEDGPPIMHLCKPCYHKAKEEDLRIMKMLRWGATVPIEVDPLMSDPGPEH
jgi:hypothetical protein